MCESILTHRWTGDVGDSWSAFCFPGASRKDQPSFTLRQVSYLCERLLKDHEEKIREEYEQILNIKLAGKYQHEREIE